MLGRLAQLYETLGVRDVVQILILAVVLFGVLRFLSKSSGGASSLGRGLGLCIVGLFLLMQVIIAALDLTELSTVLDYLLTTSLLAMVIVFQPELRRGLKSVSERRRVLPLLAGCHTLTDPPAVWEEAGDLGFFLARKGVTAKSIDLVIATYALAHGVAVLAADRDFADMNAAGARLTLVHA